METNDEESTEQEPTPDEQAKSSSGMIRRKFLRAAAVGGVCVAILSVFVSAFDFFLGKARSLVGRLLDKFEESIAREAPRRIPGVKNGVQKGKLENEDEYRAFIASLGLKYISATEVIRPHRNIRNGIPNELPPQRTWKRLSEALLAADAIREELGVPLRMINSAYRSRHYNAECSGAVSNSYHTKNMALDLVYACSPKEAAKAAQKLREEGVFTGGIGVYSSFIHIDTRGRKADWGMSV